MFLVDTIRKLFHEKIIRIGFDSNEQRETNITFPQKGSHILQNVITSISHEKLLKLNFSCVNLKLFLILI